MTGYFDSISTGEPRFGQIGLFSQFNWLWFDDVLVEADSTAFPPGLSVTVVDAPSVSLFPNPSRDGLVTIVADRMKPPFQIALYDITGRLIHRARSDTDRFKLSQDVRLNPGLYFIRLVGRGQVAGSKLVVSDRT